MVRFILSLYHSDCVLLVHFFSGVVVGLQQTLYSVGEGNGSLSVCALLIGTAERNVVVSLLAISQTAQGRV